MAGRTLGEIADGLYASLPQDFTAARDDAARGARADNRELSQRIKALRRPSAPAWAVNSLVRARPDEVDELLALGTQLRESRDALDGAALRTMTAQRQQVVRALSASARELADEQGQSISDAAMREIESTLDAALADAGAAQAVRSGRLIRPLVATGLEPVELDSAVAVPEELPALPAPAAPSRRLKPVAKKQRPTGRDEQALAKARAALDTAALDTARSDVAGKETALAHARDAVAKIDAELHTLQRAIDDAGGRRSTAEQERRAADAALKQSRRDRDRAERALEAARRSAR